MKTRYHGYPEPSLSISEIMKKLANNEWAYVHMQDTFEPAIVDATTKKKYAVPEEVIDLRTMIYYENMTIGCKRDNK